MNERAVARASATKLVASWQRRTLLRRKALGPTLVEAPPQKAVCILDISICMMYISICVLDKADIHVGIIGF